MVFSPKFASLACALVLGSTGLDAIACSPHPDLSSFPKATQAEIDRAADQNFERAEFIALVTVQRSPRYRFNGETEPPPLGLLRVETIIKGSPSKIIRTPPADPCLLYFQVVGEKVIVGSFDGDITFPLPEMTIASLRRRNLGDWQGIE